MIRRALLALAIVVPGGLAAYGLATLVRWALRRRSDVRLTAATMRDVRAAAERAAVEEPGR